MASALRHILRSRFPQLRRLSTTTAALSNANANSNSTSTILDSLSNPTWSVKSLLPPSAETIQTAETSTLTPEKLQHLLRLAALPPPSSPGEESQLLKTLLDQLHFVKDVQSVDTAGILPLQMIRDEVDAREFTIEDVDPEALGIKGEEVGIQGKEEWNVLGMTNRKIGSYFVVDDAPETNINEEGVEKELNNEAMEKVKRDLEGL